MHEVLGIVNDSALGVNTCHLVVAFLFGIDLHGLYV